MSTKIWEFWPSPHCFGRTQRVVVWRSNGCVCGSPDHGRYLTGAYDIADRLNTKAHASSLLDSDTALPVYLIW